MQPISRRLFLVASASVVVAACSSDDDASTGSSAPATDAPSTTPVTSATATTAAPSTSTSDGPRTVPTSDATTTTTTTTESPATTDATTTSEPPVDLPGDPFTLGVASGDPSAQSVVLWTRLAPDPLAGGGMPPDDVEVTWQMARDAEFTEVDHTGVVTATAAHGHSVHVDARPGPGSWFYRFQAGGFTSPVGATRVAPAAGELPDALRFASASCQNYEDGFYIAHRDIAAQQPDFVVFLGDYIYEAGGQQIGVDQNVRTHGTPEITTLDDYRNRYALYKSDPDLQAAHAACPWFVVWDDHEVENNYAALLPQDPADAAAFVARRAAAYQAWWEHQPVALEPPDGASNLQMYRSVAWGGLMSLALLDTRQYRSDQACGVGSLNLDPPCPETFDPARTMIGAEQEEWLKEQLTTPGSVWRGIGQQVIFGDTTLNGAVLNYDQWDGYPVQRDRIVQFLAENQVPNVVVLTGDIHFGGIGNIRFGERGTGTPVGVEMVATSISSGGLVDPALTDVLKTFPDVVDAELLHRGYILHTVTSERWSAEFRMVDSVKVPDSPVFVHNTYTVDVGTNIARIAAAVPA